MVRLQVYEPSSPVGKLTLMGVTARPSTATADESVGTQFKLSLKHDSSRL